MTQGGVQRSLRQTLLRSESLCFERRWGCVLFSNVPVTRGHFSDLLYDIFTLHNMNWLSSSIGRASDFGAPDCKFDSWKRP